MVHLLGTDTPRAYLGVRPREGSPPAFLVYYFNLLLRRGFFANLCNRWIGQAAVNNKMLAAVVVPTPPLAEQRRIVAKVDQLMALCDELEERQRRRAELRVRLNRTALHRLTTASDDGELGKAWERVQEQFPLLYDTPETVGELRKAIRQLAVRGKLVPQNPDDEPASVLLDRLTAERNGKSGRGRGSPKPLPPVVVGETPAGLPPSWQWARLGSLVHPEKLISYGVLVPGPDVDDGIPFVRIQDISAKQRAVRPRKSISPEAERNYARTRLEGGEILLGVVGSIGVVGIAPAEWKGANIARALCRIAPAQGVDRDYLACVLLSPHTQNYFAEATRTLAQPTLNVAPIEVALIPVPPPAEQRRIVAQVDQLMALCDDLEARLTRARDGAERLAASVVHHLSAYSLPPSRAA